MFKWFNKKKKDNKGFTLVELVVVVAILAILVGLLAPQYTKYVEKSRKSADASNLENMVKAVEIAAADASESIPKGQYTIKISNTTDVTPAVYPGDSGTAPEGTAVENALEEFVGDGWEDTSLKSQKWVDKGSTDGSISAVILVDAEGATSVSYNPESLKELQ